MGGSVSSDFGDDRKNDGPARRLRLVPRLPSETPIQEGDKLARLLAGRVDLRDRPRGFPPSGLAAFVFRRLEAIPARVDS